MTATPPIRLAPLLCDAPIPPVLDEHGDYRRIFDSLLRRTLPVDFDFTLDAFDDV